MVQVTLIRTTKLKNQIKKTKLQRNFWYIQKLSLQFGLFIWSPKKENIIWLLELMVYFDYKYSSPTYSAAADFTFCVKRKGKTSS